MNEPHKLFQCLLCFFLSVLNPLEAHRLRSRVDRQLESLAPFTVELVVAVFYADSTLEEQFVEATRGLANSSSSLEPVQHFCKSVNKQATSHQVNVVSLPLGVTVDTKISSTFSLDTECSVTRVRRKLPNEDEKKSVVVPGSVILQVTVEQVVYVTSAWKISQEEVSDLVQHGFMRTTGGRARFRSLLVQNPAFNNVVKVELQNEKPSIVWEETKSSPSPSTRPSSQPSFAPLLQERTPSTKPHISSNIPSFDIPTSVDFPTFESTETIEKRDKKEKKPHITGIIVGLTALITGLMILGVYIFCIRNGPPATATVNTNQNRIHVHDGTSGQNGTNTAIRITKIVEERMVENEWEPEVRVPCDSYDNSLMVSSRASKENRSNKIYPGLYQSALDMIPRKAKVEDSDDEEEDLFVGVYNSRPQIVKSNQRNSTFTLASELLRSYRAHECASILNDIDADVVSYGDLCAAQDSSTTVPARAQTPAVTEKDPKASVGDDTQKTASLIVDRDGDSVPCEPATTQEVPQSAPLKSTPIGSDEHHDVNANEDSVDPRLNISNVTMEDSSYSDIKTIMMREFPNLPQSNSFDLKEGLEPLPSPNLSDNLKSRFTLKSSDSDEPIVTAPRQAAYCGPLWSVLWEARQMYEEAETTAEPPDPANIFKMQLASEVETFPTVSSDSPRVHLSEKILQSTVSDLLVTNFKDDMVIETKQPLINKRERGTENSNNGLLDEIESTGPLIFEDFTDASHASGLMSLQSTCSHSFEKCPDNRSNLRSLSADHGIVPRWLDEDLKRYDDDLQATYSGCDGTDTTSVSFASVSTHSSRLGKRYRVVVAIPPGKLGIVLTNRSSGPGTFVSKVRPTSCLRGLLSSGDKLVALDGEDITLMTVSEVTSLITARSDQERTLTVLRKVDGIEKRVV
ncbi:hypothetical protein FisN_14Lh373 [Fistulifera solaris]|uniref:PDZ domain-containing protein n=1 Tax=Fistulifera solaris TaxID=1519565 RepID=A0A1Z5JHY1_FISSO|nr:hypothetical protein FisN_14Lh373 [Fistulifera solaris]|eukprot:GAX13617.1 hypothetical protein FisN_14Lh373 [Fistulifera solaris]